MKLDVECADHRFQISDLILLLFDIDSKHAYFFLHVLYFFGVFFVLLFEFFEKVVCLFF
jgi:hypothetical protein